MTDIDQKVSKGKVLGSILLIAGCCIGAGMLGLPILSAQAGFVPTLLLFFLSWLFMATTGLLLLEVNLWYPDRISLISMADRTLGRTGKILAWLLFLFLFYSLMVAYIAGTGELLGEFIYDYTEVQLSSTLVAFFATLGTGIFLYYGTGAVDHFNRLFMLGLGISYVLLVALGSRHVHSEYLEHQDWSASLLVIPAMIISFGFHNLVPSVTSYLRRERKTLSRVLLIGSSLPLIIYLIWEWLILGLVPLEGGFKEALDHGDMVTLTLKNAVGSPLIVSLAQYFAFFAIITSFLGVALSFVDLLVDGLHLGRLMKRGRIVACVLVLAPSFLFALLYPKIFLIALNYAGGFGAVILFGVLPAAMVWSGRYRQKLDKPHVVPGGKPILILVMTAAALIFLLQLVQEIGIKL